MGNRKRVWRAGVRFDCPECGRLWKDDEEHGTSLNEPCETCGGLLWLVAKGDNATMVGDANWYRCTECKQLYMKRRGAVVPTPPRSGFEEFTNF